MITAGNAPTQIQDETWMMMGTIWGYGIINPVQSILYGIQSGVPKIKNLAKVYEIRQKKGDSPGDFLERIYQAYR